MQIVCSSNDHGLVVGRGREERESHLTNGAEEEKPIYFS